MIMHVCVNSCMCVYVLFMLNYPLAASIKISDAPSRGSQLVF